MVGTGLSAGEEPVEQWEPPESRRKDMLLRLQRKVSRALEWHPPLVYLSALFGDGLDQLEKVAANLRVGTLSRELDSATSSGLSRENPGERGSTSEVAIFKPESVGPRTASPAVRDHCFDALMALRCSSMSITRCICRAPLFPCLGFPRQQVHSHP